MASNLKQTLGELNKNNSFTNLLEKLIGETQYLQNNPDENLIPQEDRVVNHVLDFLKPFSDASRGPLEIKRVSYVDGRANLIVKYSGSDSNKVVSFVGCHMDVVPADPNNWTSKQPFKLIQEGDKLYGRGTTDCLGHVALVAQLMRTLGETKPKLKHSVVAIFIANEEYSAKKGVGVDKLHEEGWFDRFKLKNGPLYWIDTADSQPCIGTGGMILWKLQVEGKLFHSGLPHKGINAMELGMDAFTKIQSRFYKDFPSHADERKYFFEAPSSMKPTKWSYPGGSISQIPAKCTIEGDVRLTPFYRVADCEKKLREYVKDVNDNIEKLAGRGPSKYVLPEENRKGSIELEIKHSMDGVACKLDSRGYNLLKKATEQVIGPCKPVSTTGSLPVIRKLQDEGYDVQMAGYGLFKTYHYDNEYCLLSDMSRGYKVLVSIISQLEDEKPARPCIKH